jgi:hypothetical protein
MEALDLIMRYVVVPIAAAVWLMYQRQQDHSTKLAVLTSQAEIVRTAHDREIREIKDKLDRILQKLDDKADKR